MASLYINIGDVTAGVSKKLEAKCAYLNRVGFNISLVMVIPTGYLSSQTYKTVTVDFSWAMKVSAYPFIWRLTPFFEQWAIYEALTHFIKGKNVSYVVLRYPIANYFLLSWLKQLGSNCKVIFEHNTMELHELRTRARNSFHYKYSLLNEILFGRRVRRRASGIIGVTGEIANEQLRRAGKPLPFEIISNGIDVETLPIWKGKSFDGKNLSLILLAGSDAPWHGVDILLNSIEEYKGDCQVSLLLVGRISASSKERIKSLLSVTYVSTVYGEELDSLIDSCHIGVGTLGIESSFMKEACTLKVREYWARGLPFILGYEDTDLMNNPEMRPFYLKVGIKNGMKQSFSLQEVVDFAKNVYAIPNHIEQMRENAMRKIHYAVKASETVAFLKSL